MIERFLVTYSAAAAARILSFLALIASVRLLGNEANGQLVLSFSLAATALVLVLQGQRSGIVYFLSRREIEPSAAFSNSALFALAVGGLGALVLFGLAHYLPEGP